MNRAHLAHISAHFWCAVGQMESAVHGNDSEAWPRTQTAEAAASMPWRRSQKKNANPITKSEKPKAIFCLRALLSHFRAHGVVLQGRWSRLLTQKHALAHGRRRRRRRGLGGETKNPKRQNPSTKSLLAKSNAHIPSK